MSWRIIRGDVLDVLQSMASNKLGIFDGSLSDPPYGLKFMGKRWDHGVPSVKVWLAMSSLLRPGASVLAFGGTRTYHRLACNIEDSGLALRDSIAAWMYGSGWPKPANVSKFIDKTLGRERPVIGPNPIQRKATLVDHGASYSGATQQSDITAPSSPEAARFEGYHANLAPAWEPVIVARKPLDRTLANNALEHGLAGFNVDGCRVEAKGRPRREPGTNMDHRNHASGGNKASGMASGETDLGRWPANVILTCDEAICGPGDPREIEHQPGCHVFELDAQSGSTQSSKGKPRKSTAPAGRGFHATHTGTEYEDSGGCSRYFYTAKVSKSERGVSAHPCMKPIVLTTYLARLILPPPRADGQPRRILVPFSGSGSEMIGCLAAGWDEVVGIEQDESCDNPGKRPDYWADVAEHRIREWEGTLRAADIKPDIAAGPVQLGLL